jgi:hypothetical protein
MISSKLVLSINTPSHAAKIILQAFPQPCTIIIFSRHTKLVKLRPISRIFLEDEHNFSMSNASNM